MTNDTEVRELAAAILDALDVPFADSSEPDGTRAEARLTSTRAALLRGVLSSFLSADDLTGDLAVTARTIRAVTADTPVTYVVHQEAEVAL